MDDGNGSGRGEARRLLEMAKKHLHAHDLVGSKHFAERALEADPLAESVDQILAIVDVLLASQTRVCNQPDWYAVLHLAHPLSPSAASDYDSITIKRSFRRLAILLSPDRNKLPCANYAYRFVVDAFSVLSNPQAKSVFDNQLLSSIPSASSPMQSFWTFCHSCYHVFEYDRAYIDRTVRCEICMRPFHAVEMASAPPIVPGIDMYYCAWGFIPLGFPGSQFPNACVTGMPSAGKNWQLFYPVTPWWGSQTGECQDEPLNVMPVNVAPATPNTASAAATSNHLGDSLLNRRNERSNKIGSNDVRNIADAHEIEGIGSFVIDLDATEDALRNLHELTFM